MKSQTLVKVFITLSFVGLIIFIVLILIFTVDNFNNNLQEIVYGPCRNNFSDPACTNESLQIYCQNIDDKNDCIKFCQDLVFPSDEDEQKEFCEYRNICGPYNRKEFLKCPSVCSVEQVCDEGQSVSLCSSFEFDNVCFELEEKGFLEPNVDDCLGSVQNCEQACKYESSLQEPIENYIFCTRLSEYKSLNPCHVSLLDPKCDNNEFNYRAYCANNLVFCSALEKTVSLCECQCYTEAELCDSNYCKTLDGFGIDFCN